MRKKPTILRTRQLQDDGSVKTVATNVADIQIGTQKRHHSLPHALARRAKAIWKRVGPYLHVDSQSKWLDGFCYDTHPEKEIAIWEGLANCFERAVSEMPEANPKAVMKILSALSSDVVDIPGVTGQSEGFVARLRSIYDAEKGKGLIADMRRLAAFQAQRGDSGRTVYEVLKELWTDPDNNAEFILTRLKAATKDRDIPPEEFGSVFNNILTELENSWINPADDSGEDR